MYCSSLHTVSWCRPIPAWVVVLCRRGILLSKLSIWFSSHHFFFFFFFFVFKAGQRLSFFLFLCILCTSWKKKMWFSLCKDGYDWNDFQSSRRRHSMNEMGRESRRWNGMEWNGMERKRWRRKCPFRTYIGRRRRRWTVNIIAPPRWIFDPFGKRLDDKPEERVLLLLYSS